MERTKNKAFERGGTHITTPSQSSSVKFLTRTTWRAKNLSKKCGDSLFCMTVARSGVGQVCSPTIAPTVIGEDAMCPGHLLGV
jgi:hypothetical protein